MRRLEIQLTLITIVVAFITHGVSLVLMLWERAHPLNGLAFAGLSTFDLVGGVIWQGLLVWLAGHYVMKQIGPLRNAMNNVRNGDFNVEIPTPKIKNEIYDVAITFREISSILHDYKNEMGQAIEALNSTVVEVGSGLDTVAERSRVIVDAMKEITDGAMQAAETADLQMRGTDASRVIVDRLEQGVQSETHAVQSLNEAIVAGAMQTGQIASEMQAAQAAADLTMGKTRQLVEYARSVEQILMSVEAVAESTNLIALNASIEAARAGEAGRGFAVVANEVRILAEQSQDANKRIQEVVRTMVDDINNVDRAVADTGQSFAQVEQARVGIESALTTIRESGQVVEQVVHEVLAEFNQQRNQTTELQNQSHRINDVVQQVMGLTEEVAASTTEQNQALNAVESTIGQLRQLSANLAKLQNWKEE